MGAYFQAEKLKNRHTFLWGFTILMPLVCSLLSAQLTHRYFAMAGYNWWYMMMMPGFLTIICGLVGGKDLKKQNRTIGSLPADTGKIWDAKVLLCAVASGMATFALTVFVFFGTLLLKDGLHMVFINPPSFGNQILAAVLIWITSLWQLPFCLFLTQKTGVLPAAVLNLAAGQIVGPLASLKAWFFLIPYGTVSYTHLSREEAEAEARKALFQVGFKEKNFSKSPFELSGGQKKRVAIAGVLAMNPKILILDEPTAGLDPKGRDEILDQIAGLHKERGITIILVSHSMEDVARYAERMIVVNHGSIAFDDTPRKVFTHYQELEKMGLAAPQITYIMHALKEKGLHVDPDATTVEEAAEDILEALEKSNSPLLKLSLIHI